MSKPLYVVEVATSAGPVISRVFSTIKAARSWAMWCRRTMPARIMLGGQGGMEVK